MYIWDSYRFASAGSEIIHPAGPWASQHRPWRLDGRPHTYGRTMEVIDKPSVTCTSKES